MFSTADMFATGRCRYPSKFCPNARAQKSNGELHRFCEEHRAKANDNQKRWSSARQRQWDAMEYQAAVGAAAAQGHDDPRTIQGSYQNPLGGSSVPFNGYPLDSPQAAKVTGDDQRSKSTTTARVVARTPSQVDQYLTHLLFRNQSSSETDEHVGVVGMSAHQIHS